MDLYTFNPPNRFINIDNGSCELGPFSIKIMSLIQVRYGSLKSFNDIIKIGKEEKDFEEPAFLSCMIWLSYNLLVDKNIKPSDYPKLFLKKSKNINDNIKTILKTIEDAQPIKIESAGIGSKKSKEEDDFVNLYVHISTEIKFTIAEFYEMTSRQITQISSEINQKKNKDYKFQCALHGAKVEKTRDNRPASEINFSQEDNDKMQEFIKSSQERLMKERAHLYN